MNFKDLQRILKGKEEVIVCTFDGIERRIFVDNIAFDLDMQHIYLKKLKLNIRDIARIKKIENKKEDWVTKTLEYKETNKEDTFLVGEDFQIKGTITYLNKDVVMLNSSSFNIPVVVKLDKITSIY